MEAAKGCFLDYDDGLKQILHWVRHQQEPTQEMKPPVVKTISFWSWTDNKDFLEGINPWGPHLFKMTNARLYGDNSLMIWIVSNENWSRPAYEILKKSGFVKPWQEDRYEPPIPKKPPPSLKDLFKKFGNGFGELQIDQNNLWSFDLCGVTSFGDPWDLWLPSGESILPITEYWEFPENDSNVSCYALKSEKYTYALRFWTG